MRYLGEDEAMQTAGVGYFGEVAQGPDGMLYQWVEGVDGLGNPVGFWKKLGLRRLLSRAAGFVPAVAALRAARPFLRRALPFAQRIAPFIPGYGPAAAAALRRAAPILQQAGITGYSGLGALYQAPDGAVYQMQGLSEDDDLRGLFADEELQGLEEQELDGLEEDEELRGLDANEELEGFSEDEELRGVAADEELQGLSEEEALSQFSEEDALQGLEQGYVREPGMEGVDAFVPQLPPATRWFTEPTQPPPLWKPLW